MFEEILPRWELWSVLIGLSTMGGLVMQCSKGS